MCAKYYVFKNCTSSKLAHLLGAALQHQNSYKPGLATSDLGDCNRQEIMSQIQQTTMSQILDMSQSTNFDGRLTRFHNWLRNLMRTAFADDMNENDLLRCHLNGGCDLANI